MDSLYASGTSPPFEIEILDTRCHKLLDRFGSFLAVLGLAILWLASFNKILAMEFSIVLTTMVFSEWVCMFAPFIITVHLYLLALFIVVLVNRFKMTF